MASHEPIPIFVENRAEVLVIMGIFREFVSDKAVAVEMAWDADGVMSMAKSRLLRNPDGPVVVVLNCQGQPNEFRDQYARFLSRVAPQEAWHMAIATPSVLDWTLLDDGFKSHFDEQKSAGFLNDRHAWAVSFKDWAKMHVFDRQGAGRKNQEFNELEEFIKSRMNADSSVR